MFHFGTDTYVRLEYKAYELYLGYNQTLSRRDGPSSLGPSSPGPSSPGPSNKSYLPLAPQDKFSTTLTYANKHFRFGIEAAYVGAQYLYNNQKAANYWYFAGAAEYHYNDYWRLMLNAENLFNVKQANYETVVTGPVTQPTFRPIWAPLEGRIVNLALKYTL